MRLGTGHRSWAARGHFPEPACKLEPAKPAVVAAVLAAGLLLHLMCCMCCRVSWHLGDVVDILKDLRWGEVDFGNLRYRNYSQWCARQTLKPYDCPAMRSKVTHRHYMHQTADIEVSCLFARGLIEPLAMCALCVGHVVRGHYSHATGRARCSRRRIRQTRSTRTSRTSARCNRSRRWLRATGPRSLRKSWVSQTPVGWQRSSLPLTTRAWR